MFKWKKLARDQQVSFEAFSNFLSKYVLLGFWFLKKNAIKNYKAGKTPVAFYHANM